jgi:hypothetical protein
LFKIREFQGAVLNIVGHCLNCDPGKHFSSMPISDGDEIIIMAGAVAGG